MVLTRENQRTPGISNRDMHGLLNGFVQSQPVPGVLLLKLVALG
jgi:hypothetical protein